MTNNQGGLNADTDTVMNTIIVRLRQGPGKDRLGKITELTLNLDVRIEDPY